MPSQTPANNQGPTSDPINHLIDEQMDQITDPNLPFMEKFGRAARQVAIAQYASEGRGVILGVQNPSSKKFVYVQQENIAIALWMTAVSMKRKVAKVVEQYYPDQEAVVVMVVPPTAQLYHVTAAGKMDLVEIQEVEQTTIKLPSGVKMRKEVRGENSFYNFYHQKLGMLGRIILKPHENNQTLIEYELASVGFDPQAEQRKQIFIPLAEELANRLELGLMR
ncbi:hypothetical protein [Acaryochloris sp. CCMEE 5410]|uniref:hypothetical protein n=1 Tax=Acaryochloris sp. CCMEE 5410 TaxID=310037 RepID=UPI00024852A6|nr:hypothetical protein [Acaryochloris sp. CCMEE 5410]KAI9130183.1 hypothetical protein ON05_031650 [Acaryochloris sp. CCMEE 5410]